MSENSSPSGRSPARSISHAMTLLGAVTLAMLTANVWLASELIQQRRGAARERDFWALCQRSSTPAEREAAFLRLVAAGNREWRSAELRALNLAGVSLRRANLQLAPFIKTNLAGANLEGAMLFKSILELADLTGAQLSNANLAEARLVNAILKGATLRGASLCASSMEQVQAENANFTGADLSDADCRMANLTGAKLRAAKLSGARLESARLKGADLSEAHLDGADLTDADFTNANWWCARGLTRQQLAALKKKFSPTADADAALQEDYARWTGEPGH